MSLTVLKIQISKKKTFRSLGLFKSPGNEPRFDIYEVNLVNFGFEILIIESSLAGWRGPSKFWGSEGGSLYK